MNSDHQELNSLYSDIENKCYSLYKRENKVHFIKLLELYKDLCKKAIDIDKKDGHAIFFNYMRISLMSIYENPVIMDSLNIENDIKDIEQNYIKYGCLILRDPKSSNKFLTGCGNNPVEQYYLEEDKNHQHSQYITLDPSLLMNPTIIGIFGHGESNNLPFYFKDINFKYDLFASEGYYTYNSLEEFNNDVFIKNAVKYMFKENFDVVSLTDNKYKTYGKGYEGLKSSAIIDTNS